MDLVPLDDDVISLELERPFADCVLDGDASPLFAAAAAVMRLQREFGLIPRIQARARM
jgi:vacuolar protein sorting-associated protein 33A